MYNPPWFREDDLDLIRGEIKRNGFGTLVTVASSGGPLASHVPMILDETRGQKGTLYGHVARGNLQWRDTRTGSEALAIFLGPDAYITPRWYETKKENGKVVPTWDYVAIHVRGPITFFHDTTRIRDVVTRLTNKHESGASDPWEVSDAPRDYIESQLKSIVGFEVAVSRIDGKWKMSQNRPDADRMGVVRGLAERDEPQDAQVSQRVREQKKKVEP